MAAAPVRDGHAGQRRAGNEDRANGRSADCNGCLVDVLVHHGSPTSRHDHRGGDTSTVRRTRQVPHRMHTLRSGHRSLRSTLPGDSPAPCLDGRSPHGALLGTAQAVGATKTSARVAGHSVAMFAEDTAGLMDVLGLATGDVAGLSMGGSIALELAATHPERVQRLVLISTSAAGTGKVHMSLPMRVLWLLRWIPGMQGKHPRPRFAHRRQRTAATTCDGTGRLGHVTCPTLILHGRQDRSIPFARARQLQAGIPQARLQESPGGHLCSIFGGTPPGCRGNRHLPFLVSRPLGRPRLLLERCDRIRRAVSRSCRQAGLPQTDSRGRAPSVWCV